MSENTREELLAENEGLRRMLSWAPASPVRPVEMTMRQYYKAAALQGMLANPRYSVTWLESASVRSCAKAADAMLAEDEEHAKL